MRMTIGFLLAILLMLTGCGGGATSSGNANDNRSSAGDPADTVERYLRANINSDGDALRPLLCSELESAFEREVASFSAVTGVRLENMNCTRNPEPNADGATTVTCTGQIAAEYGSETTTFPLRTYRVVEEDGLWRWCGEAAP
jgi:hypothetical protein